LHCRSGFHNQTANKNNLKPKSKKPTQPQRRGTAETYNHKETKKGAYVFQPGPAFLPSAITWMCPIIIIMNQIDE
jgi:hypothetical protein